jgi:hypothetical protein
MLSLHSCPAYLSSLALCVCACTILLANLGSPFEGEEVLLMPTQDDTPLVASAAERTHPAYAKLARACITLARLSRDHVKPPQGEVARSDEGVGR